MIESVTLENWKTHKASTFHFGKGTNVLVGVIGSGKSSVMDGLCYGLFGTFPAVQNRRVSVSDLLMRKPYSADQARVEVCFSVGEKKYRVERILKRSGINEGRLWCSDTLIAGPKPNQVTERVEKELDVSYELFTRAVYSEQNQVDYFLKLNPGDRKKKVDELLELQKYEGVRANVIQIVNQFRKQEELYVQSLSQFDAVLQNQDLNELRLNASIQTQKISTLSAQKESISKSLALLSSRASELESALTRANSLKEKIQRAEAQRDSLRGRMAALKSQFPVEVSKSKSEIESQKADLSIRWTEALQRQEKVRIAESAVQKSVERVRSLDSRLAEIKGVLQSRSLEDIESSIFKLDTELAAARHSWGQIQRGLVEANTSFQLVRQQVQLLNEEEKTLDALHAACPTCKQEISLEHKSRIRSERSAKRIIFQQQEKTAQEKVILLQKELSALDDLNKKKEVERRSLALLGEKAREHVRLSSEHAVAEGAHSSFQKSLSDLGSLLSPAELEQIQSLLARADKALEFHALFAEEGLLSLNVERLLSEFSVLSVSQEQVLHARQSLSGAQSTLAGLERESLLEKKVFDEISARIRNVELVVVQQRAMHAKRVRAVDVQQSMGLFANVLVETQQQLRETVVEAINAALSELWPWVYPYKDFTLARLLVQDSDYVLTVQERNGYWVSAESSLSGGERSAAALTLRMAIAFVLTRQLSWMILDEPTHNLDAKSISTLSEVLRVRLPDLVDQVFVITHSAEIEKAATGSLYVLQREKNEDGCTIPLAKRLVSPFSAVE